MIEAAHITPAKPITSKVVLIGEAVRAATEVADPASKANAECPCLFNCHHIPSLAD